MFSSFLDFNKPLIITHYFSNESISNISFRTVMNALDLEYCSAWDLYPSILKHRYHFLGVGSVGDRVVVVVVIVYPKEEERKLFFRGVSNECESSMSFTSVLPLWLVLLSNPADAT